MADEPFVLALKDRGPPVRWLCYSDELSEGPIWTGSAADAKLFKNIADVLRFWDQNNHYLWPGSRTGSGVDDYAYPYAYELSRFIVLLEHA